MAEPTGEKCDLCGTFFAYALLTYDDDGVPACAPCAEGSAELAKQLAAEGRAEAKRTGDLTAYRIYSEGYTDA